MDIPDRSFDSDRLAVPQARLGRFDQFVVERSVEVVVLPLALRLTSTFPCGPVRVTVTSGAAAVESNNALGAGAPTCGPETPPQPGPEQPV